MKIQITLKSPDSIHDSIENAKDSHPDAIEDIEAAAKKWIKYGEYVTIEIDINAGTAIVKPVS